MIDGTDGSFAARLAAFGADASDALQAFTDLAHTSGQAVEESRQSYEELLVEHRALQQELADVKNAQRVHGGGHVVDPYVMVLIDAHSHMFQGNLLSESTNGGSKAAKMMKDQVGQYITSLSPGVGICRIVVRVYANLKGLDAVEEASRTFAGFAAGFSREDSFFDFVDVGDQNIVRAKIVDLFKVSVKDSQCRHVLLGACRDAKYLIVLQMHSLFDVKVSYIKSSASDSGIEKMGLKNVSFSQVFRTESEMRADYDVGNGVPLKVLESGACWDFQKGWCFRKDCKYKHAIVWATPKSVMSTSKDNNQSKHTPFASTELPKLAVTGMIPISANDQRLDLYMPQPSEVQWARFTARTKAKKLCNAFHLRDSCPYESCEFDHSPLDGPMQQVLKFVAKERPCNRRGACRRLDCVKKHVCQKPACMNANKKTKGCILGWETHGIEHTVDKWVQPGDNMGGGAHGGSEVSIDEIERDDATASTYREYAPLIDL